MKNILLIGANSGIGTETAKMLAEKGYKIYATSRGELNFKHKNIICFKMDVCDENSIREVAKNIKNEALYAVINFAGAAISSPVEFLDHAQLQKQFDVVLFGLLKIIQNFYPKLNKIDGRIINISSMASFGIFPFISPYCASKAAGDIILNTFGIETGTKIVSIKPGVIKTPFWENSLELNKCNFENFGEKYSPEREFLIKNAQKNGQNGLCAAHVAKTILKALEAKNPKASYTVGFDAKMAQLASFLPKKMLNLIIKKTLKLKITAAGKK